MKVIFLLSTYVLFANIVLGQVDNMFEGAIHYKMNYTDLKGNNINNKVAAFFDLEHTLFVDESNFKIVNEKKQYVKLFQGKYNAYFFFNRNNTAYKLDQGSKTTQFVKVVAVDDVDTILGYPCKALKIDADFRAYIYFYNPDIKINTSPYVNYNMEEWNVYLNASNGALPLRVITIDIRSKFIEEKTAIHILPQQLTLSEFDFPKIVKLKPLKYGLDLIW